jgi:acyl-CoA reductase-like NAD-dependent aldehyde dehydrogenase
MAITTVHPATGAALASYREMTVEDAAAAAAATAQRAWRWESLESRPGSAA